ncbi:hypothetical protein [Aneurinibacillus danicus]|jgi:hypothetical protein|uniref:Glycosyltransferase RgtA/B/C/D-like domain-containing protein n=1 Tax=Aneurinibacillus danicus TaxID=267746 RepID=A0A511VAQ4_9BACL|nr:hypothetical protein [Aneurinibacillus danicus]GEN34988.1 hypothetical protein ADA01nite_24480 [Aneurinibacillus danicus]
MKRAAVIALLTLCIRLPFLADGPGGWDDVDFALGMQQYDLAAMQPHFPGYPVYMFVAFLFGRFIENPFLALSAISALAAALVVFPLHRTVRAYSGLRTADAVALLWSVAPLSFVLGTQPLSDSFGTLLSVLLVASSARVLDARLDERRRAMALLMSGVWLGLLYGVRVSYLAFGAVPLWAGWMYGRETRRWSDVGFAVLCSVLVSFFWSYAMAINVGSVNGLLKLALAFTGGHFSDWGGTYTGGSLGERLVYWIFRQWFAAGLGTPWPGQHWISWGIGLLLILSIGGWRLARKRGEIRVSGRIRELGLLFMWVVPYGLWAFFAQNADKPRHILPLLIPLLWAVASGLLALRRSGPLMIGMLACCMFIVSWTQVDEQRRTASPMAQLADYAASHLPASAVVYTYEEERVMRYKYPALETVRLRKWEDFQTSILSRHLQAESVFMTENVLEGFGRPEIWRYVRERARFNGNPWLYPTYHEIVLYEVRPEQKEAWQRLMQN